MSAKVLENSPQSPNLYESQSKKIRRSFFKNDVAVKSYKCDFTGADIWTSAKLYVSNKSLYVVHRPKRKKMTTISFSEISSITQKTDNSGVDIGLLNGSVYSLTNFQRPESAIAFLLNFWSLTRKDKPLQAGNTCLPPSGGSDNSSSAEPSRDLTTTDNSLSPMMGSSSHLPSPGPITVSLNSSASMSETDSLDSRRMTGSHDAKSLSSTQISASGERANRASTARTVGRTVAKNSPGTQSAEEPILPVHSTALQKTTAANLNRPTNMSPLSTGSQISQPPESVISKRLSVSSSVNRTHIPTSASAVELKRQGQQPVYNNSSTSAVGFEHSGDGFGPRTGGGGGAVDRTGTLKHRPISYIPDPPGWSIWPLSFLPYPFSSPPQRLTMIIAYAILAFLLFSTMHLYHRLAVFDLSGNPILTSTGGESHIRPLVQPGFRSTLHQLESQLSQLVELTGQLTQSLIRLNSEVRNMQFQADAITPEPMVAADIKPS